MTYKHHGVGSCPPLVSLRVNFPSRPGVFVTVCCVPDCFLPCPIASISPVYLNQVCVPPVSSPGSARTVHPCVSW